MADHDRPNILLVMSDEHAPQTMGCMGAEFARTPNLDRLAQRGVVFDNAYCNFALCVPSRSSFMTGLLPHRIDAFDNGAPFASTLPTWAHMVYAAGYRTVLDGKMHFVGPDQRHGFEEHHLETPHRIGGYRWGEERPDGTAYRAWENVDIVPDDQYHTIDVDRQRAAVEFLDNVPADRPFCLTVGTIYPHYPQVCTQSAYDVYDGVAIPDPTPRGRLHPRNAKWSDAVWGFDRFADTEAVRTSRRVYLAMVTMMDAWIGELLDTLERTGLADNTLVIYTSDHGDMWGEHTMWGKNLFYEESSRVPLIVSGPPLGVRQGQRVATPVSLVDVYPTLRDVVGADAWRLPLDGRSLWPTCLGQADLDDVPVFCEYYASDTLGSERMVRFGDHKLNFYHHQGIELFDLARDPHEQHDVSDDPGYASVRDRLLAMVLDQWDPCVIDARIREDQNRRALLVESRPSRA